jgi:hypothetical protein
MDQVVIVTYPQPIRLEARQVQHDEVPDGTIGLAYFYERHLIARGVVTHEAVGVIRRLLDAPVTVALAATQDGDGNIEGRVCLMLPMDSELLRGEEPSAEEEPWRASVPQPPAEIEESWKAEPEAERPQMALLPLGNVIRTARHRNHPDDVARDAREMLENLLSGRSRDAVNQAIDDLLDSI